LATTAAAGCIFGIGLAEAADTESLSQAYGEFQQELCDLGSPQVVETVNTDGWEATQQAWTGLFCQMSIK
jgi:hypothetical protein